MSTDRGLAKFELDNSKVELLKRTICKGASDEEFQLFVHACNRSALDPFMRQIYAVKRWDASVGREVMAIQTGIDGYRLIAERSRKYAPGREPTYTYEQSGQLLSATAYVKKQTPDGTWHEVSATAYYKEYAAFKKDGNPTGMWQQKPHIMLAKCAEALALRRAFPADLSGIYCEDEMQKADVEVVATESQPIEEELKVITYEQAKALDKALDDNEELKSKIMKHYKIASFSELLVEYYDRVMNRVIQERQRLLQEARDGN